MGWIYVCTQIWAGYMYVHMHAYINAKLQLLVWYRWFENANNHFSFSLMNSLFLFFSFSSNETQFLRQCFINQTHAGSLIHGRRHQIPSEAGLAHMIQARGWRSTIRYGRNAPCFHDHCGQKSLTQIALHLKSGYPVRYGGAHLYSQHMGSWGRRSTVSSRAA